MANFSLAEMMLIALIAVIFLRPDEFRTTMKTMGRWVGQMRRMSQEFTTELVREADLTELRDDVRKIEGELRESLADANPFAGATAEDFLGEDDAPKILNDEKPVVGVDELDDDEDANRLSEDDEEDGKTDSPEDKATVQASEPVWPTIANDPNPYEEEKPEPKPSEAAGDELVSVDDLPDEVRPGEDVSTDEESTPV